MMKHLPYIFPFLYLCLHSCATTKVFSFQEDGYIDEESNKEWALLTSPELPELKTMTICTWFRLYFNRLHNQIWSYCAIIGTSSLTCNGLEIISVLESRAIVATISDRIVRANITESYRFDAWNLACILMKEDKSSPFVNVEINFNGNKIANAIIERINQDDLIWPQNGVFIIGQEQDELGAGFEVYQSYSGAIGGIDIWNQALDQDQLKNMATCQGSLRGNILDWSTSKWNLTGGSAGNDINPEDLCKEVSNFSYIMVPQPQSLRTSYRICEKLGGQLPLPKSNEENEIMLEETFDFLKVCNQPNQPGKISWLNLIPDGSGKWLDRSTYSQPTFTNWKDTKNEKQTEDNCAFMVAGKEEEDGKWSSTTCSELSPRNLCTLCIFESSKMKYTLRGLCSESRHDKIYYLEKSTLKGGMPFFKGISSSIITYNESLNTWVLTHLRFNSPGILLDESLDSMPIGRKKWLLSDRSCGARNRTLLLTLTKCETDEFTCNDGSCEPIEHRCDLKPDCDDGSDEADCKKVAFDEVNYEGDQPPRFAREDGKVAEEEALPVVLNIDLLAFDEIDTVKMMFSVIMELNITWRDRRLDYLHLRDDPYQNTVSPGYKKIVWIPEIGLSNAKTGRLVKDENTALLVVKQHAQDGFDSSRAIEDTIYKGHLNDLLFVRRYQAEYHCVFDLRLFPFDEQECKIVFKMRSATKKLVKLSPGELTYQGPKVMVEFVLDNLTFHESNNNSTRSEVVINFKLTRQYVYHISQSFFQSFLLGFLSYLTFYIDVQDFNERFIGALTALLVLASLLSSMTANLPKTSYFKIIDVWLLFFLIVNSAVIAIHIIIDRLQKREDGTHGYKWSARSGLFKGRKRESPPLQITVDDGSSKSKIYSRTNSQIGIISQEPQLQKLQLSWMTAQRINYFFRILLPLIFFTFILFLALSISFRVGVATAIE